MEPWQKLPLSEMRDAMEIEQFAGHHHRPTYTWFRTFSRRSGSLLRFLLLATLSDLDTTTDDLLEYREDDEWRGNYVERSPLENTDAVVIDPMMGAGPTILEGSRLGLNVIGLDYNPVLWWVLRQTVAESTASDETFASFLAEARNKVGPYFECPKGETVLAFLMALTVECPKCARSLELHPRFELSHSRDKQSVYLCPNTDCAERVFESETDRGEELTCESCETIFTPDDGNYVRGTFQCQCGYHERLSDYFDRRDNTPSFSRYAVYYEDADNERRYRGVEEMDHQVVSRAQSAFREKVDDLPVPTSKIQEGETTRALLRYNFDQYRQLFTDRQCLVLGRLFELADSRSSQDISETLVTLVASTLQFNTVLTAWNPHQDKVESVFRTSDQRIHVETVEANPLAGHLQPSLETAYERFSDAKSYLQSPHEMLRTPSGDLDKVTLPGESLNSDHIMRLSVSSADRLDIKTESVDCAVVDPPYYDTVQYGELLDFYYVWLREVLKDEYPELSPTHVPKLREISVNRERGKDVSYYLRALRNSFEEIQRVLAYDGDLICLFHFGRDEAWRDLTTILVQSGFQIRGAISLQEPDNNKNTSDSAYDAAVFAKKTPVGSNISFATIRQNLLYEIHDMAEEERTYKPDISDFELRTILRARGLAEFSDHYPNVHKGDGDADIDAAIEMVDEVLRKTF